MWSLGLPILIARSLSSVRILPVLHALLASLAWTRQVLVRKFRYELLRLICSATSARLRAQALSTFLSVVEAPVRTPYGSLVLALTRRPLSRPRQACTQSLLCMTAPG
eukprot:Rmarinus@m.26537